MKKIKRVITALFAFTFLIYCSVFRVSAIVLRQNEDFCLLVLGVDDMWSNTDTIMLVKVDSTAEKINVLSIPRDTMVCYDGRICKINSVFAKCISTGMSKNDSTEAVKSFVNDALGVTIDFSVVLDSYAFISISLVCS